MSDGSTRDDRPHDSRPFDPEREDYLLSAYVDGELEASDVARVEAWLDGNPDGRREVERLRRLEEVTGNMVLRDAPPETWESFFDSVYHRAERGIGWMALTLGLVVVGGYGLFELVRGYFLDGQDPWWLKAGVFGICFGILLLMISVIRERFFTRRLTRYDDVTR